MTDEHHDCTEHEHFPQHVYLDLTPGGLRLNVLGLVGHLYGLLKTEDYEGALELVDVAGQMLTAAYTGHYDLLENGYTEAMTMRFKEQLDDPNALDQLVKEEEQ